jgi:hypothetical protein
MRATVRRIPDDEPMKLLHRALLGLGLLLTMLLLGVELARATRIALG